MNNYIMNSRQQDSDSGENFEVHNVDVCTHLPDVQNRISLGTFYDCTAAVQEANRRFPEQAAYIDGCFYCSRACHTE